VEPYHQKLEDVITRIGFKNTTTLQDFEKSLHHFGKDDSTYELLSPYPIVEYDGWTIEAGVIHSPGPYLTFEIQKPQDDFNLCCWKLGTVIDDENQRIKCKHEFQLRGLIDEKDFMTQVLDWNLSSDSQFKEKYYRPSRVLEQGEWGRTIQIFFDGFYGEGFEIQPHQKWERKIDKRPFGGIVWSGKGFLNGNKVDVNDHSCQEFLIIPNTKLCIEAGDIPLLLYVVFPLALY